MGNRTTKSSSKVSMINIGQYRYWEEASQRLVYRNTVLGQGDPSCSGVMWRGYRDTDKQPISVKKLLPNDLANQEIDALLSLDHSNILLLLDVHVELPYVYVISEFCTCDLEEFLSAVNNHIDWRDQLPVLARNLAHGYNALHQKRIIHRNINPHTVVVVHKNTEITFKLSGFEYSKRTGVNGAADTVITVNLDPYKAPELGAAIVAERALTYDHRIDIWSLGIVLHRCSVGRIPWSSGAIMKLFWTLATSWPKSGDVGQISNLTEFELTFPPDVPEKLADLLRGMLEIRFSRRMTSDEFLNHDYFMPNNVLPAMPARRERDLKVGSNSPTDSFALQTKQIEQIGKHTLRRKKQLVEERRLRDFEYVSNSEFQDDNTMKSKHHGLPHMDHHYTTLRHEDDENECTLRQPTPSLPPPLPPRKKSSLISANGNDSSDTGSVGSQTLLAEGMNILSEPGTIRSAASDVSIGRNHDPIDQLPETDLDNGQSYRTVMIGPYEYKEEPGSFLGRGSFGSVWTGRHRETDESVAIKSTTFLDGADREIRILRSVDHPNVLGFLYAHKIANTLYMVTELCRCDLKSFLDASPNRRVQNADVRKVARDLAMGYKALHSARILHRDIKPKNILLAHSGDKSRPHEFLLKLADFGCGRFRESSQCESSPMTNGAMGTMEYMAPEVGARQMNPDSRYDARADIWSIGVVLHECACGQLPLARMELWRLSMSIASNGRLADNRLDTSTFVISKSGDEYDQELKNLLYSMLQPVYKSRLTPDEFFRHPYVNLCPMGGLKLATYRPRSSLALVQ